MERGPHAIVKKVLSYVSLSKLCPCIDRKKCFLGVAWLWTILAFISVLAFLRSIDEDMEHSQIVVFDKTDNQTVLFAAKGSLNLRGILGFRKITILLDFGVLLLIDFISHILLIVGLMTNTPDLIMQWIMNSAVLLVLLSTGSMIQFNPKPNGLEGKIIAAATLSISLRLFYGAKAYVELSGQPTDGSDDKNVMDIVDNLQDVENNVEELF